LAIVGVAILVIPAGASAATSGEGSSNNATSIQSPESITMTPSNLSSDNQLLNRTDETLKPNATLQGNPTRGIIITNTSISFPYEITVRFDSITVHDNHEYFSSSNGEYDLSAFVQGNRIDLTDYSTGGAITFGGEMPKFGLGDASEGETIYFDPGAEVTVYLPTTLPLSIFTVGQEVDECGRVDFDDPSSEYYREELVEKFKHQPSNLLDWLEAINHYLYLMVPSYDNSVVCTFGSNNDRIDNLIKFYGPVDYGAGAHTNVVSNLGGDFTLRYTITVTPPPITGLNRNLDSNALLNQTQQNNTFATNLTR
jgi:hypothetical protein